MRKFKINLNESKERNSGKTWDSPSFVYFYNMSYYIYENDIIIIFDFIRYKIEFSIYESSLFDNFLNVLHLIFSDSHYGNDLGDAIKHLAGIRQKNMFYLDEKTGIFTLDFEIAKELGGVRQKVNNILYGIKIYFSFYGSINKKNILKIDKFKTKNNLRIM